VTVSAVIGTQWGDEGKGKVVDMMAGQAQVIVRFQGGNNAGHTVIAEGEKFELHLIPSGILYPEKKTVMGGGMVVDPWSLLEEIDELRQKNISFDNFFLSDCAHLVLPYHLILDQLEEEMRASQKLGTTSRGIGPAYVDKAARRGLRMGDLLHRERLAARLQAALSYHNNILEKAFGREPYSYQELFNSLWEAGQRLAPYIGSTTLLLDRWRQEGLNILFEGAQGTLLDIDHGTYPYVTSSNTVAGAAGPGAGLGPGRIDRVIGVTKAYQTRVGEGPFPTEDPGPEGDKLRKDGGEYGVTTGRPRRCGWLDLPLLRHACRVNGVDWLALTKIDVLRGHPQIRVATGYQVGEDKLEEMPTDTDLLQKIEPVYEMLPGWEEDLINCRTFEDLPANAQQYVQFIEEQLGLPIQLIGVGPQRQQIITRGDWQ